MSQPKLGQIANVGCVLKTSGPADSKSVPGFNNWPRFVGVIEQNKISNSYENYCTMSMSPAAPQHYTTCDCLQAGGKQATVTMEHTQQLSIILLLWLIYAENTQTWQ